MHRDNDGEAGWDAILVSPSLDSRGEQARMLASRVETDVPNQETPHIGVAYMLAVAKQAGYRVKFVDMVLDGYSPDDLMDLIARAKPRLVGFTGFSIRIKAGGALAAMVKERFPDVATCAGGVHISALPLQSLEQFPGFDFIVVGESELIFPRIIEKAGDLDELAKIKGVVVRGKTDVAGDWVPDIGALPFPAWEEFDLKKYGGTYPHRRKMELPMLAARGCPYRCNFCMRASGDTVRTRPVEAVIAEIRRNIDEFGCDSIAFLDESFAINKKWTDKFLSMMVSEKLNERVTWSCSMRVTHNTPELFQRMAEAGCYYAFFGLESADDDILSSVGKKTSVQDMLNSIDWCKKAGIVPVGAFIIGLPGADEESVVKSIDLADRLDLYSVTFPIAVPFPGTKLREMAERNEAGMRILSDDWDHYGKQDTDVLESDALSRTRRRELQTIAYTRHPKKKMDEYLLRIGPNAVSACAAEPA